MGKCGSFSSIYFYTFFFSLHYYLKRANILSGKKPVQIIIGKLTVDPVCCVQRLPLAFISVRFFLDASAALSILYCHPKIVVPASRFRYLRRRYHRLAASKVLCHNRDEDGFFLFSR